ncbi:Gliding motility-associated ABC transporter ATP-binding protein GldA [hydrothermal vent metagenome]|uniref:Gliding motility-associated ABC transporter ATP-binding protein GldA n=1 Tax=hydrothermal vent metagenome TaxID=652676 RepID=A0A3B0VJQ3_9ZZZZ
MIECKNLTKKFNQFVAVDNLSFVANKGEVLGFLGPNGAGKSTTMKMITGFLTPTSGSIKVCGIELFENQLAVKNKIGYLPEGAPSYDEMRVCDFIKFIAQMRGISKAMVATKVDEIIDRINLSKVYYQRIDTLSKGFKRRVGLAQALIHDPEVLVLDEPTDGLDPNQKHDIRQLITSMAKNKTIIISTHILEEVHAVCDRAIIIADGIIVADNTPTELENMSRYHNAVTFDADIDFSLLDQIKQMSCVRDIEYDAKRKKTTVFPTQGVYVFDEISDFLKEHKISVTRLSMEAGRLDEVFRNITLENNKEAA